jgi:hypothetical protein
MKNTRHFLLCHAQFFIEWEMFQEKKIVEKMKTSIFIQYFFFLKSCSLWDKVDKYCRAGQATDDNMAHAHCMLYT